MRRLSFSLLAFALAGCDQPAAPPVAASVSAAPVAAPPPEPAAPAVAAADLDVASVQKALKCATDAKSGACGVLAKFSTCKAWDPIVPSGDGRWLGRGLVVEGAKTTEQFTLVRSRRVPTSEVGAGQLGAKVAVTDLPKEESQAFEQADRTIRIFERADTPGKANATIDYVKKRAEWPEMFTTRTTGGQVYAQAQEGTYFCQGAGRSLLLVQRAAGHGASGDGLYAELWPTSW